MTNVLIGRVPFVLGIALGALAWLCADARRRRPAMLALAALLALATVWASPPAGLFLAWRGRRGASAASAATPRPRYALALPPIVGGLAVAVAFPEGGARPLRGERVLADVRARARRPRAAGPAAPRAAPRRARGARPARRGVRRPDVGRADGAAAARDPRPGAARARPAAGRAQVLSARSSSGPACCTCSGCPPYARSPRRRATPRRRAPTTPRCCGSSTASASRASAWRSRSRATTGRRRSWRRGFRSRAAGTASSTRRPTRSSTTAAR